MRDLPRGQATERAAGVLVALFAVPGIAFGAISLYAEVFKVFTPSGVAWQQLFVGAASAIAWLAAAICGPVGLVLLAKGVRRGHISIGPAVGLAILLAPSVWALWLFVGPWVAEEWKWRNVPLN